ncbi:FACL105Cp [Eremothecium gossypii FDAG1]|nr:FACL105Cp [Eremothecium gossypii FDAG1]
MEVPADSSSCLQVKRVHSLSVLKNKVSCFFLTIYWANALSRDSARVAGLDSEVRVRRDCELREGGMPSVLGTLDESMAEDAFGLGVDGSSEGASMFTADVTRLGRPLRRRAAGGDAGRAGEGAGAAGGLGRGGEARGGAAEAAETAEALDFQPPPSKLFAGRVERPISNDSIVTEAAETLSTHFDMSASTSSSSRGSSVVIEKSQAHEAAEESATGAPCKKYLFASSRDRLQLSLGGMEASLSSLHIPAAGADAGGAVHSVASFSRTAPALVTTSKALTPSQRYRLRREQNKVALQNSIKQREVFYEEQERGSRGRSASLKGVLGLPHAVDELSEDISDYLGWDVPVVSPTTGPFLAAAERSEKHTDRRPGVARSRSSTYVDHTMPPSPIPGIQKTSDLEFFTETSKKLSCVYLDTSKETSKSKLYERSQSAELLPIEFKAASDEGMEDLKLVSSGKMAVCSNSRPSWLPPKDTEERARHERQIRQTIDIASLSQIDRTKERAERDTRDEKNRKRLAQLVERGLVRKSTLTELKKICWETSLPPDSRFQIYTTLLQSDTAKLIEEQYIDNFDQVDALFRSMQFPNAKLAEIQAMLACTPCTANVAPADDLIYLLQLKAISRQGLLLGDPLLVHHLLQVGCYSTREIWVLVNILQLTCFNETTKDKYDRRIISSRGTVSTALSADKTFAQEFNSKCLNFTTWWHLMARLDHAVFMWCLDIIVAENSQPFKSNPIIRDKLNGKDWDYYRDLHVVVNYRIICALTLTVLLSYHFGFNNLYDLSFVDPAFQIIGPEQGDLGDVHATFIKKWHHNYKKF